MKTVGHIIICLLILIFIILLIQNAYADDKINLKEIKQNFQNPPMDCWPHTRWWWPGNPVDKKEITWELEQMRQVGIRGVEQITMSPVYEKGGVEFMSNEFLEMIRHTIKEAKRLGMEVSLNFGGPGWIIGGEWVPEEDKSKDMIPTSIDLVGPQIFHGPLPDKLTKTKRSWEIYHPFLSGDEKLLAAIAGKVIDNRIDERTIINLTSQVKDKKLEWKVPAGHWKLMCFWLAKNGHDNTVDHFNKGAMQRYCEYLGGKIKTTVGKEFGKTLESLFCDSFELPNLASGIYWSTGLFEEFKKFKGYDLTRHLPAIWWEVGDISPKIRYDVNEFLHHQGLEAFFKTFLNWCEANGIKGRIQTYGFTTDNIEAAGITHIPETEITPGEKDQADWFDTRIGPKKYVTSGAHIYGRKIVSVEAYTFMHWERYRATMEDLKIATDGFLRTGANKFYNHGFSYLPERDLAPSRRMPWAPQVNPSNVWWKYYDLLTQYIARCSYLLRQGDFAPDIAVYSPLANQWTLDVLNPRKWTREFDWGDLGFLLVSNGYDFDLLNDDALQNIARFEDGKIKIRNMEYKVLLLPNIKALPLETMEVIEDYVKNGGAVIAFDRVPEYSTGLNDYQNNDKKVQEIVSKMFVEPFGRDAIGKVNFGKGYSYYLKNVIDRRIWWDTRASTLDPFLKTIQNHIQPDFGIDFAYEGIRRNEGLTFLHRKIEKTDVYFVTNIQDRWSTKPVTFRVKDKIVWEWNPYDGSIRQLFQYLENEVGTNVPLHLAPYESTILVFEEGQTDHVIKTDFYDIQTISQNEVTALANENGVYFTDIKIADKVISKTESVNGIPSPLTINGTWQLSFKGKDFPNLKKQKTILTSWTDDADTKKFSGTVKYSIEFDLPNNYIEKSYVLKLDLGKLGNIAEVELNGNKAGIIWMREQTLDITDFAQIGENQLTICLTNTDINRVSGLKEVPPVPKELVKRFGSGTTEFSARKQPEIGFEPLPASGLMRPVRIVVFKKVQIKMM
jgi:hypothetical protein